MARDAQAIQAEIERARDALAVAVDEITNRVNPKLVVERTKRTALEFVSQPKVKYPLIGVGVVVVALLVRRLFR